MFCSCPNIIEGFWIISKSHVHVSLPLLLSIPAGLHPNNSCLLQSTPFSNSSFLLSSLENIVKGTKDPNHHIFKTTWQPPSGNSSSCFQWKLSIALKASYMEEVSPYIILSFPIQHINCQKECVPLKY